MSNQLEILISDRTFTVGDQTVIVSKPKWSQIETFGSVVENLVSLWTDAKNDTEFIKAILKESAKEIREGINTVLNMCLRKNNFQNISEFIAEFEYDVVFALLFEIVEMNKTFFTKNLARIGIKAAKEEQAQPGES